MSRGEAGDGSKSEELSLFLLKEKHKGKLNNHSFLMIHDEAER